MFGRLLKHELITNSKLMIIICSIIIGLGVLIGLISLTGSESLATLAILALIAAIEAVSVLQIIQIFKTIIKNTFDKRGYITFQIPVTSHQIILSKILSILISIAEIIISILISLFLLTIIGSLSFGSIMNYINSVGEILSFLFSGEGIELLLYLIGELLYSLMLLFFCVTLANTGVSKGNKIVISILIYIGLRLVVTWGFALVSVDSVIITSIVYIVLTVLLYFLTVRLLDKKLELQ